MIEIQGDKTLALRCNPNTLEGCDDKMKAYITKAKTKFGDRDELEVEIARLLKISGNGGLKDELQDWMQTRLFILQQMAMWSDAEGEELWRGKQTVSRSICRTTWMSVYVPTYTQTFCSLDINETIKK